MKKHCNAKRTVRYGFTLVEIMVVIVILVMLASVATPLYFRHLKNSRIATAKTQISMLEQALDDYRLDNGDYPDELAALMENTEQLSSWDGPYIKPAVPKDPWGADYVYLCPGLRDDFDLISYGADNQPGGEGKDADVNNWEMQ